MRPPTRSSKPSNGSLAPAERHLARLYLAPVYLVLVYLASVISLSA